MTSVRAKRAFLPSSLAKAVPAASCTSAISDVAAAGGEVPHARRAQTRAAAGDEERAAFDFHGVAPILELMARKKGQAEACPQIKGSRVGSQLAASESLASTPHGLAIGRH